MAGKAAPAARRHKTRPPRLRAAKWYNHIKSFNTCIAAVHPARPPLYTRPAAHTHKSFVYWTPPSAMSARSCVTHLAVDGSPR